MDFTLYKQLRQLTNWLLPQNCISCQCSLNSAQTETYCDDCIAKLPYLESSCPRCGQPFTGDSDYCGKCLSQSPTFDACFCPFAYEEPISDDICRLKYGEQPRTAIRLARLFARELNESNIDLPEALIPVPMHPTKLRKRGFNQSTELAKQLGKLLDIPLASHILSKQIATPRQATQTLFQRKTNLKGAFKIHGPADFKHLAIVDDVVTTGATAEEIAKILKKNGVDYVQVWGITRTR